MKILQFDFGELIVLREEKIVIGRMVEGAIIDESSVRKINNLANSIYNGSPWIYISNRELSYSVDPMLYQKEFDIEENMVGFIVVAHRPLTKVIAEFERNYNNKKYSFVVCNSLYEATSIARNTLDMLRTG